MWRGKCSCVGRVQSVRYCTRRVESVGFKVSQSLPLQYAVGVYGGYLNRMSFPRCCGSSVDLWGKAVECRKPLMHLHTLGCERIIVSASNVLVDSSNLASMLLAEL